MRKVTRWRKTRWTPLRFTRHFFLTNGEGIFRHEDPHSRPRQTECTRRSNNKHFRLNHRGGTENIAVSTTTRRKPPQTNEHANIAKAKQGHISKVERKTGSSEETNEKIIIRTKTPLKNNTHSISIQNRGIAYQHCHATGGICGMGLNITFFRQTKTFRCYQAKQYYDHTFANKKPQEDGYLSANKNNAFIGNAQGER